MRGYHIRIVVQRKSELPLSQTQPGDYFVPTSLFQQLPAQKPKSTARKNVLYNAASKDYRFGPLQIDWVNFEDMSKASYSTVGKGREHGRGMRPCSALRSLI